MATDMLLLILIVLNVIVFAYFLILNGYYLVTSITSFRALRRYARRLNSLDTEDLMKAGGAPPVALLVPAYNEEVGIEESVRSLLDLHYPEYEILVINDGSTDGTLDRLRGAFDLRPSARIRTAKLGKGRVRGLYRSRVHPALWVIDKENGGKADALNVGLDHCQAPFFCSLDADSALERDALLRLIRPFLENGATVAAGGIVRVANGSRFDRGRVVDIRLPKRWLPQLQVVEYLRAFLAGRMGWSSLNVMLIVSGAFGMFRRSAIVEVGGYASDTVGEDMELTLRLHRHFRDLDQPYEVAFVPDPVAWTEVPERFGDLGRQRDRWQRGLLQSLSKHKAMLLRPKYGRIGMLAFPYFWFMEGFGPVVELAGYVAFVVAIALGWASMAYVLAFLILAVVFGTLLSVAAVALEELVFRRYQHPADFSRMLLLSVVENFGYRQLLAFWRFRGVVSAVLGRQEWGRMERRGVIRPQDDAERLEPAPGNRSAVEVTA
jgi:cellulose synthase/poly-beta-1,6-N-acetylglucosamine synthase-like glycosyltransferase